MHRRNARKAGGADVQNEAQQAFQSQVWLRHRICITRLRSSPRRLTLLSNKLHLMRGTVERTFQHRRGSNDFHNKANQYRPFAGLTMPPVASDLHHGPLSVPNAGVETRPAWLETVPRRALRTRSICLLHTVAHHTPFGYISTSLDPPDCLLELKLLLKMPFYF